MTREDAIKILKAIRVYECYPKSASEETKEAIDMAIEALSRDRPTGWIPVSERLPEKEERILVTVWGDVDVAWRDKYGIWESDEYMYEKDDITAWMPLPEPYKGGEDK